MGIPRGLEACRGAKTKGFRPTLLYHIVEVRGSSPFAPTEFSSGRDRRYSCPRSVLSKVGHLYAKTWEQQDNPREC